MSRSYDSVDGAGCIQGFDSNVVERVLRYLIRPWPSLSSYSPEVSVFSYVPEIGMLCYLNQASGFAYPRMRPRQWCPNTFLRSESPYYPRVGRVVLLLEGLRASRSTYVPFGRS